MTGLALAALIFLVLLNGYFVAAEFALVRVRRGRMEVLEADGARGAGRVLHQLDEIDRYLAACQLGITMASIGIGFLGEPALASLIEPLIDGPLGHGVATAIAFGLAFAIATALHITVGEQVPKIVAINRAEEASRILGPGLGFFRWISYPFTWGLTVVSNAMIRLFGVDPERIEDHHDAADLRSIIQMSGSQGDIEENEATMLTGVFHLHDQQAREVMTPIPAVVTVNADETVEDALRRCVSSGHTRLVVIEDDNPDRVRGVVHNNSLARLFMNAGPDSSVVPAIRDVPIVPETKPLDELLEELQRQRSSMGVVCDEYGRTVGIATVEDIIEEIVGEIEDETDPRADSVRKLTDGDWYVRGHVSLGDLEDAGIQLPVESDAYNSIGGYVFSELGRLPKRGDTITADGMVIRVEQVRENRIVALRIHPAGSIRAINAGATDGTGEIDELIEDTAAGDADGPDAEPA